MARKEMIDRLASIEQYPFTATPQQFSDFVREQSDRWNGIIKASNIKIE